MVQLGRTEDTQGAHSQRQSNQGNDYCQSVVQVRTPGRDTKVQVVSSRLAGAVARADWMPGASPSECSLVVKLGQQETWPENGLFLGQPPTGLLWAQPLQFPPEHSGSFSPGLRFLLK